MPIEGTDQSKLSFLQKSLGGEAAQHAPGRRRAKKRTRWPGAALGRPMQCGETKWKIFLF